ncbi:MAG: hypothetical protein LBT74_06370 [Acidobacteriota bacterium]|jgi:predicted RNA-binding Zn-ribbon protein involved in translation (DUF1610 family)|nr:hypothetical protein [Acidobacteriota bacterium]
MTDEFEAARNRVATMAETDRKCPQCGGVMDFDPASAGLKCPYCGHTQELPRAGGAAAKAAELDFASAEQKGNCDWGAQKKTVICKSCGAESIYDALQVANTCPYCGSNQVMDAGAKDTLAPGGVCPFKIDAQTAGRNFTKWIGGKLFCPGKAKRQAKPDAFQGVYLPYWTFDAQTTSEYSGRYGYRRTRRTRDNKTETYIEWHSASGTHREFIDDQLVMGTGRYDGGILAQIEPFHTGENVAYKPEYLAGFVAERYSVGLKDAWERAKDAIKQRLYRNVESKMCNDHGASTAEVHSLSTRYANVTYKYLMLPVWMSAFKYKEKTYRFVVNGQTGRVGGRSPISALRVAVAILLGLAAVGVLYYLSNQ